MSSDLTKEYYAVALLDLRKRAPSAAPSRLQPQIKVFTKLKVVTQISERDVVHPVLSSLPCTPSGPDIGPKTGPLVNCASPEATVKNETLSSSDQRLQDDDDSDQNGNRNDSNDNGNENEHENDDWHDDARNDDARNDDDENDDDRNKDDEADGDNAESHETDSSKAIFRVISLRCPIPNCPQADIQDFDFIRATYTIDKHARRLHGLCSMPSICLVCNRQYSEQPSHATEDLDKHLQEHHSTGAQLQCYKCSKSFKSYSSVNRHNHLVHFEACFGCPLPSCNFTASTRIEIYRHNREEHPKFCCSFEGCNSKFKYRSEFRRHNWTHAGVTQFQCTWPDCDWQGSNIRALVWTHVKEFHLGHEQDHEQYVRQLTFTEALREKGKLNFEIQ